MQDATDEEQLLLGGDGLRTMKGKGKEVERGNVRSRVLHMQAPDVKTTSIRWGALSCGEEGLGISLPFLHLAVKDLGQLFYFDVGVLDERGQLLLIRISTWQVSRAPFSFVSTSSTHSSVPQSSPKVYAATEHHPSLLHLPLQFPPPSPHQLTPWTTITLCLSQLLSTSATLGGSQFTRYKSLQTIEVHANCRLRRIWCTEDGVDVAEGMVLRGMMAELAQFEAPGADE